MAGQFGPGSGYTPMPGEPVRGPVVRPPAPPAVLNTVRLMLARAALGVVSLIVLMATEDSLKGAIAKKNPTADAARLDSLLNAAIVAGIIFGVIFLVLYVLLALQVRKGKNWARIVSLILAALGVLNVFAAFVQTQPPLSRVVGVISGLVDIAIIFFLTRRQSTEYFRTTT